MERLFVLCFITILVSLKQIRVMNDAQIIFSLFEPTKVKPQTMK